MIQPDEKWEIEQAPAREPGFVQPVRRHLLKSGFRAIWRMIDRLVGIALYPVTHPKLRLVTLGVLIVATVWTIGFSDTDSAFASVGRPLSDRAAFNWEVALDRPAGEWLNPAALEPADAGQARVRGMALHRGTMGLKNYGMSFLARMDGRSIGWVLRAADTDNHYVFKLTQKGARAGRKWQFDLVRYAVVAGRAASGATPIPVTVEVPESRLIAITARVTEDQIHTLVNGYGVDSWQHPQDWKHEPQLKSGGVGFVTEPGDSFVVQSLTISGNEDFLGKFLWGARETYRSLKKHWSAS